MLRWPPARNPATIGPSLAHAWNAHEIAPAIAVSRNAPEAQHMSIRSLQTAALWFFLGPLIIVLGTADILTNGRSRAWPLG